jgi:hypothetical protein
MNNFNHERWIIAVGTQFIQYKGLQRGQDWCMKNHSNMHTKEKHLGNS